MTDLDLPPVARTEANFWKAKYFQSLRDLAAAHRGIGRLKRRGNPKQAKAPSWYTPQEMHHWLICRNYAPAIADELATAYAFNLQNAFEKGLSMAKPNRGENEK
jgi:hypothetical protein